MKKESLSVAQLNERANKRNPRTITPEQLKMLFDSMRRFGDLSGFVLNKQTGNLVGGHQRAKLDGDATIKIERRYSPPTRTGTVSEGFALIEGERFTYREVSWDEATENAAMIAANKHGGDWDFPALSELLAELDKSEFDLGLTGFSPKELEKMVKGIMPETDEITPLTAEQLDVLPAHVRMVQLFLTTTTLPEFMDQVRELQEGFGCNNITDTVVAAVNACYHHRHDRDANSKASGNSTRLPATKPRAGKKATATNGSPD